MCPLDLLERGPARHFLVGEDGHEGIDPVPDLGIDGGEELRDPRDLLGLHEPGHIDRLHEQRDTGRIQSLNGAQYRLVRLTRVPLVELIREGFQVNVRLRQARLVQLTHIPLIFTERVAVGHEHDLLEAACTQPANQPQQILLLQRGLATRDHRLGRDLPVVAHARLLHARERLFRGEQHPPTIACWPETAAAAEIAAREHEPHPRFDLREREVEQPSFTHRIGTVSSLMLL